MALDHPLQVIERNSQYYPILLAKRLGRDAPVRLWAIGPLDLISFPKTGLFCSKRCPGDAILKAMGQAKDKKIKIKWPNSFFLGNLYNIIKRVGFGGRTETGIHRI